MAKMKRKTCPFCKKKVEWIDYKDPAMLKRYLGMWAKIRPARDTGVCSRHQRRLGEAVKRARFLALLPYTSR